MNNPRHIDVCQNIEVGLRMQYEMHPDLTDSLCVLALDNAKVAIKKNFGYAKNESVIEHSLAQGIIDWCVEVGMARIGEDKDLSLKEYLTLIDTVKRSVTRHSVHGARGYYEFIRRYV